MNFLKDYKNDIINLGLNKHQKVKLEELFTRWYINAKKQDIFPMENIVNINDLKYANHNKNLCFNIIKIMKYSDEIFKKFLKKKSKIGKIQILSNDSCKKQIHSSYKSITSNQFGRLQKLYTGDNDKFYNNVNQLVVLYELMGINNIQLSIPPIFQGVELFGSPLNTHNKLYCSPFEIEKKFGSLGSFWDYKFHQNGIYLCNPPFDEIFINKMSDKLLEDIENTTYKILVIITLPVWDTLTQLELGISDYGLELEGYTSLIQSKFLKEHVILDKYDYKYWDYYSEKSIPVCCTHLLILSNLNAVFYRKNFSIEKFLNLWKLYK